MTLSRHACITLSGIFAVTGVLLAGLLAYFAWAPVAALPAAAPVEAPDAAAIPALPKFPAIGAVDEYRAIAARPLFSPTRRPSETSAPGTTDAKVENPDGILLVGVILSPSNQLAVIRTPEDEAAREVSVGEKILDWRVEKILADRIVLRAGDRSVEVELLDQDTLAKRFPKLKRRKGAVRPAKPARRKPAGRSKPEAAR